MIRSLEGAHLVNMHIQHTQTRIRIPLLPLRLHRSPHKRLPQNQVRQLTHAKQLRIRLEELREKELEREVVDGWVWVEEVEIDVDDVLGLLEEESL